MAKKRLDVLMVEKGLAPSREKARGAILAGLVLVAGQRVDKAGAEVDEAAEVTLKGDPLPYVSRGGLKLEKALRYFGLDLSGLTGMDVGASTGGFTDCALQNGAAKVYAVDVGYGQLAWSLRQDPRVVSMERTNIRHLTPEQLEEKMDFATIDVAFISLDKVLPPLGALLKEGAKVVALIKPQFEAGREKVGKRGVVRDPAVHKEVIQRVVGQAVGFGYQPLALTFSPVRGPEGNIEYLLLLRYGPGDSLVPAARVEEVVGEAHGSLDKGN